MQDAFGESVKAIHTVIYQRTKSHGPYGKGLDLRASLFYVPEISDRLANLATSRFVVGASSARTQDFSARGPRGAVSPEGCPVNLNGHPLAEASVVARHSFSRV